MSKALLVAFWALAAMAYAPAGQALNPISDLNFAGSWQDWPSYPQWKSSAKQQLLTKARYGGGLATGPEVMGRVMACLGICRVIRGRGHHTAQYRSQLQEGDGIQTFERSAAWIFLMDGTLVRLGPKTSFSLKEINVSAQEIFLAARLNQGVVSWLARERTPPPPTAKTPTDAAFLPLPHFPSTLAAREKARQRSLGPAALLERPSPSLIQYQFLQEKMRKMNARMGKKTTWALLTLPNGDFLSADLKGTFFTSLGGSSYFRLDEAEEKTFLYPRGYDVRQAWTPEKKSWWAIGKKGRSKKKIGRADKPILRQLHFFTRRIPSIKIMREFFLARYSLALVGPQTDAFSLDLFTDYFLWPGSIQQRQGRLAQRVLDHLRNNRATETTLLRAAGQLREKLARRASETFFEPRPAAIHVRPFTQAFMRYMHKHHEILFDLPQGPMSEAKKRFWMLLRSPAK